MLPTASTRMRAVEVVICGAARPPIQCWGCWRQGGGPGVAAVGGEEDLDVGGVDAQAVVPATFQVTSGSR